MSIDYKPSDTHPWRQYKDRFQKKESKKTFKPLKPYLSELVESWEEVEVISMARGNEKRMTLGSMPNEKQAAWLIGLLRKMYQ